MKKFIVPLLACTALAGGVAFAAAQNDRPAHHAFNKQDMQQHHAEMCADMSARETGHMAYLEAKLSLTGAQQGAFDRWKSVKLSEAKDRAAQCASRPMPEMGADRSPLEHMAREEEMLKTRLADLQTERPALTALYNSLNDTQKKALAMDGPHGHGGPGMMGHGHMGHGPHGGPQEDGGPDGPMHDGNGPPPPPPPQGE